MNTFKKVVLHPAAIMFVLIPGLNLFFLFFLLMLAPPRRLFLHLAGFAVVTALGFYLSKQLVPPENEAWVFYGLTVLLSAASYCFLRPMLAGLTEIPKAAKLRAIIAAGIIFLVVVVGAVGVRSLDFKTQTQTMLQAIIDNDQEAFDSVRYGKGLTLEDVQSALFADGIVLQGKIERLEAKKITYIGKSDDHQKTAEYTCCIGGQTYTLYVTYKSSGIKEGISAIVIHR